MSTSDRPAAGPGDGTTRNEGASSEEVLAVSTRTGPDGAVRVTAAGEVDTFTCPRLRSTLKAQLGAKPGKLVLDLSAVTFLGSAGLAALVEAQRSAHADRVALELIATSRAVRRPLEVTGLIELFTITDGDPS